MKKINFNKDWSFTLNNEGKKSVDLPNDYSIEQKRSANNPSRLHGGFFSGGLGIYEKTFMPKKGKKYFFDPACGD